jgi:hypothetical protein
MSATLELFEQFKRHLEVQADRTAAATLGVKSQTVSNWRTRGSQAEAWLIEKMCVAIDADLAEWLLRVQMEQAPNIENKQAWRRVCEKLGYQTAGLAALLTSASMAFSGGAAGVLGTDVFGALSRTAALFVQLASEMAAA